MSPIAHRIRVGTASWTDLTLIKCGRFYPKGCSSAEDRLRFYASQFPLVEVNSSYYALPSSSTSQLWAERTPSDFVFNVRAFRLFTDHQTPIEALPPDVQQALGPWKTLNIHYRDMPAELVDEMWRQFTEAAGPLEAAGKLGALHFQYAPWLVYSPQARAHVAERRRRLPGRLLTVEFRHQSWFSERNRVRTLSFERDMNLVNTVLDAPQGFFNSVAAHWDVTNANLALVRLHGRNTQTWNAKGLVSAASRFNYDYSDLELDELSVPIAKLAQQVAETHVVFNNNMEDQGQHTSPALVP